MGTDLAAVRIIDFDPHRAQIPAVFRAISLVVRALYLLAVTCAPLLYFGTMTRMVPPSEVPGIKKVPYFATIMVGILIYGALPASAWLRMARRQGLLPAPYLRTRPAATALVALLSALGTLSFTFWAYAELYVEPIYGEGNSLPMFFVSLLLYAVTLLLGEWVLMRRLATPTHGSLSPFPRK